VFQIGGVQRKSVYEVVALEKHAVPINHKSKIAILSRMLNFQPQFYKHNVVGSPVFSTETCLQIISNFALSSVVSKSQNSNVKCPARPACK
jgi:hypothetical protein